MKVGIDFHAAERPGTGNCSYIRNLVECLLDQDGRNEYCLYVRDPLHPYFSRFKHRPGISLRPISVSDPVRWLTFLGRLARRDRVDLLHVQYVPPLFYRGGLVVSVHDLSFLRHPEWFPWMKRLYLRTLVPRAIGRADLVLTISEFSRSELVARFPECASKVQVTYLAAGPGFRPPAKKRKGENPLESLGIRGRFILYVGRLDYRKNISLLLRAFSELKKRRDVPHQLVLAGPRDYVPRALRREWSACESKSETVWTGLVSDALLAELYGRAEAFVYPSRYEGFGLPVLEAMACGCPVVCSEAGSLPEIAAGAALLVPPGSPEALTEALAAIVSNSGLRAGLGGRGVERSRRFSWETTAGRTLEAYGRVAASRGHSGSPDAI
jgi:glycosyltransferase involved in cell wall biosynthesis